MRVMQVSDLGIVCISKIMDLSMYHVSVMSWFKKLLFSVRLNS